MNDSSAAESRKQPWLTVERLEAIADGVIAIIITILVLEINVPENHDFGADGVLSFLHQMSRSIMVYFLSFCLIGVFWLQHHVIFHYVARTDRNFIFLNGAFLFFLSLSPFSTQLAGDYPGVRPAEAMFGLTFLLTGLAILAMWRYVHWKKYQLRKPVDHAVIRSLSRRLMVAPGLIVLGMAISTWKFHVAALIYFSVPIFYFRHWLADTAWQTDE